MAKKPVSYFVSYARADKKLVDRLMEKLSLLLGLSKEFDFQGWRDTEILPGEDWTAQIDEAIEVADVGLLLVSLPFLASEFITEREIGHFVGSEAAKRAIPVVISRVPLNDSIDLKGLEKLQLYRLQGRSFNELVTSRERDEFVGELFEEILKVVRKYFEDESS